MECLLFTQLLSIVLGVCSQIPIPIIPLGFMVIVEVSRVILAIMNIYGISWDFLAIPDNPYFLVSHTTVVNRGHVLWIIHIFKPTHFFDSNIRVNNDGFFPFHYKCWLFFTIKSPYWNKCGPWQGAKAMHMFPSVIHWLHKFFDRNMWPFKDSLIQRWTFFTTDDLYP